MAPFKLCIDCKHFRRSSLGKDFAKCASPNRNNTNALVAGGGGNSCKSERYYTTVNSCGPDAKYFESKPHFTLKKVGRFLSALVK